MLRIISAPLVCRNWFKSGSSIMMSSPKHALLVTYSRAPHEWTAEHCVSPVVWWCASPSTAGASTAEALMSNVNYAHCNPNPSPYVLQFTLSLIPSSYWSLAVIDLISSRSAATVSGLYTCRLYCYCKLQCSVYSLVSLVCVAVPCIV